MKKLALLFPLLILLVFVTTKSYSQFLKQDAIDLVLDSITADRLDSVNIYLEPSVLSNQYYVISPYDSIESPYSNYWLAFIDESPLNLWGHDCSYVFINQINGENILVNYRLPPIGYKTNLDELNTPFSLSVPALNYSTPYSVQTVDENSHYYAV